MKSILIIGGGFGQIPAVKAAKAMGFTTICIDRNPKASGSSLADFFYAIDIVDKEGALGVAEKHKIQGVMTMQSDLPVPTVGFINERLGLKGVSYETALVCSNKIEMRKRLEDTRCNQPKFRVVRTVEEAIGAAAAIGWPCIIKAPDSSGSRGVVKVNSASEVEQALLEARKYSKGEDILVEEFICGLEFGAQTFSANGMCDLVLLHNDILSPPPYMIPIGHSFPFKYFNRFQRSRVIEDIKKAINAVGIADGPANVDLIFDQQTNEVKIIEIGARIGATCLPELVQYHTGIDWVLAAMLSAVGDTPDITIKKEQPVAALIMEAPKDGRYLGISIGNKFDETVIEFEITSKKGEKVSRLRKGTDRIGKLIVTGSDVEEAEQGAIKLRDSINIIVK